MSSLHYVTRNNTLPEGKRNIFFCCHPDDREKYFDGISTDILKILDCTVWYSDSADRKLTTDELSCFDLFVIPVTRKLLQTKNCAIDVEFRYAVNNNKAILPIVEEPDMSSLYEKIMGPLQYLDKFSQDPTARTYEQKLWNYIFSLVSDDKTVEKIRAAFDAYVFLSYRKKDRGYSNELMKLIHSNEELRDVAIWYDEFLVPGENFNDSIKKAIEKCSVFTMAVTPNLLEEGNYVIKEEYPLAKRCQKPIVPVEMCSTDKARYGSLFKENSISPEAETVYKAISSNFSGIALRQNKSPEHDFFIGLAYLEGIDVEIDTKRAVELITSAAKAGVFSAIEKLSVMYAQGHGVKRDARQMIYWEKRLCEEREKLCISSPSRENYVSYMSEVRSLLDVYGFMNMANERAALLQRSFGVAHNGYSAYIEDLTVGRLFAGIVSEYGAVWHESGAYEPAIEHLDLAKNVLDTALFCSGVSMTERGIECKNKNPDFELTVAMSDYCSVLCSIADAYLFRGDRDKDYAFFLEAKKRYELIYKYLEDPLLKRKFPDYEKCISVVYSRLGEMCVRENNIRSAKDWGMKALEIDEDRFNRLMQNGDVSVAEDFADSCFAYAWTDRENPDLYYLEKANKWYKYLAESIPQRTVLQEKAKETEEMCAQIKAIKKASEPEIRAYSASEVAAQMQNIVDAVVSEQKAKNAEKVKKEEERPEWMQYTKLNPDTPKTKKYLDSMIPDREAQKQAIKAFIEPLAEDLEKIGNKPAPAKAPEPEKKKPEEKKPEEKKPEAAKTKAQIKKERKKAEEEARREAEAKKEFDEIYEEAQNGDTRAMERLAEKYLRGIYVEKNMDEYLHWIKKASSYGNGSATYKLGNYYRIIEKDEKEAFRLKKISAKQGEPVACRDLAKYYKQKYGILGLIPSLYWRSMERKCYKKMRRW